MSVKSHPIWFFYGELALRRKIPKQFLVVCVFPYCWAVIPATSCSLLDRSRVTSERTRLGNRERKGYTMRWWSFLKVSISKIITYKSIYLNAPWGHEIREPLTRLNILRFSECILLGILAGWEQQVWILTVSCGLESENTFSLLGVLPSVLCPSAGRTFFALGDCYPCLNIKNELPNHFTCVSFPEYPGDKVPSAVFKPNLWNVLECVSMIAIAITMTVFERTSKIPSLL